jgi:hypothetical protein
MFPKLEKPKGCLTKVTGRKGVATDYLVAVEWGRAHMTHEAWLHIKIIII